jgi:hypothetical protein
MTFLDYFQNSNLIKVVSQNITESYDDINNTNNAQDTQLNNN